MYIYSVYVYLDMDMLKQRPACYASCGLNFKFQSFLVCSSQCLGKLTTRKQVISFKTKFSLACQTYQNLTPKQQKEASQADLCPSAKAPEATCFKEGQCWNRQVNQRLKVLVILRGSFYSVARSTNSQKPSSRGWDGCG